MSSGERKCVSHLNTNELSNTIIDAVFFKIFPLGHSVSFRHFVCVCVRNPFCIHNQKKKVDFLYDFRSNSHLAHAFRICLISAWILNGRRLILGFNKWKKHFFYRSNILCATCRKNPVLSEPIFGYKLHSPHCQCDSTSFILFFFNIIKRLEQAAILSYRFFCMPHFLR